MLLPQAPSVDRSRATRDSRAVPMRSPCGTQDSGMRAPSSRPRGTSCNWYRHSGFDEPSTAGLAKFVHARGGCKREEARRESSSVYEIASSARLGCCSATRLIYADRRLSRSFFESCIHPHRDGTLLLVFNERGPGYKWNQGRKGEADSQFGQPVSDGLCSEYVTSGRLSTRT